MTLVCGTAGFDGTQFKGLLANEYDIQLNKTSRNSVLLQSNINNTRSDIAHLIRVLRRDLPWHREAACADGGEEGRAAFEARVKSLMTDVPTFRISVTSTSCIAAMRGERRPRVTCAPPSSTPMMPRCANTCR